MESIDATSAGFASFTGVVVGGVVDCAIVVNEKRSKNRDRVVKVFMRFITANLDLCFKPSSGRRVDWVK